MSIFAFERLLNATVEEVGDVGILLRFGCAVLLQAVLGHHLTQKMVKGFGGEGHGYRKPCFVLREGDHVELRSLRALKAFEPFDGESLDQLPRTIGAEIEHHQTVAIAQVRVTEAHRL